MSEFISKAKLWTKVGLMLAIGVYLTLFLVFNWGGKVTVNFIFGTVKDASVLMTLLVTAVLSIIGWWAITLVVRTWRQVKEARRQAQQDRLAKLTADMEQNKAKGKLEKGA